VRLGFVVQRYGPEIDGGAEVHCRAVAMRLAQRHQVRVLTTCARDYLTWANYFPAGSEEQDGLEVLRFPAARRRRVRWFNYLAKSLYARPHPIDAQWRWLVRQGPYTPRLLDHLLNRADDYDALVFFTYLYFPTAAGLGLVPRKSVLVPTAHDEPPLHLPIFRPLFHLPRCILYNTEAERKLVHRVLQNQATPSEVVGLGIDPPRGGDPEEFRRRHSLEGPFLLCLGRVDVMKGCRELFDHFLALIQEPGWQDLKLALVGRERMDIPRHPAIRRLGFVSEEDKASALRACWALVTPSPHESLSMVTMEAGLAGKPVLVNQDCEVLARHVEESGAGLAYRDYAGFRDALERLRARPEEARRMGELGREFVARRYGWDRVLDIYERVLDRTARGAGG
jgi:glycosyltransferase involved in cell wall biosynthesis